MSEYNEVKYLIDNRNASEIIAKLPKFSIDSKNEPIHHEVVGIFFINRNNKRGEADYFQIRTHVRNPNITKSWSIRRWGVEYAINAAVKFRASHIDSSLPPPEVIDEMVTTVEKWLAHGRPSRSVVVKLDNYERPELDPNYDRYISYGDNGKILRVVLPYINSDGKVSHHSKTIRIKSVDKIPNILVVLRNFRERMIKIDPRISEYLESTGIEKSDDFTNIWSGITISLKPTINDALPAWSVVFSPPKDIPKDIKRHSWSVNRFGLEGALDLALSCQSTTLNKPKPDSVRREKIIQYMLAKMEENNKLYAEDKLKQKKKKAKPRTVNRNTKDIVHPSVYGIYLNYKQSYYNTEKDSHCIYARTTGSGSKTKSKTWSVEKHGVENAVREAVKWRFSEMKLPMPDESTILEMISNVNERYGYITKSTIIKKNKAELIAARPVLDRETDRYISFLDSGNLTWLRLFLPYLEDGDVKYHEMKCQYKNNNEIEEILVKLRERREHLIQTDKRVSDYMYEKFGCLLEDGNPYLMGIYARRKPSKRTGILYWHIVVNPRTYASNTRNRSWSTNKWTLQCATERAVECWSTIYNKPYPNDETMKRIVGYLHNYISERINEYNDE